MKKRMKKLAALCFAAAIADMMCLQKVCPVQAATEHWNDASQDSAAWEQYKAKWNTRSNDFEHVSLTPGVDETELNFAWYSRTIETPQVRFATSKEGLEENTTYYYQVYRDGEWQEPKTYQKNSFHNFSFAYVGDPQIGACKKQVSTEGEKMISTADRFGEHNLAARNDAYNWNQTLNQMLATHSDLSLLVSAGDKMACGDLPSGYLWIRL